MPSGTTRIQPFSFGWNRTNFFSLNLGKRAGVAPAFFVETNPTLPRRRRYRQRHPVKPSFRHYSQPNTKNHSAH